MCYRGIDNSYLFIGFDLRSESRLMILRNLLSLFFLRVHGKFALLWRRMENARKAFSCVLNWIRKYLIPPPLFLVPISEKTFQKKKSIILRLAKSPSPLTRSLEQKRCSPFLPSSMPTYCTHTHFFSSHIASRAEANADAHSIYWSQLIPSWYDLDRNPDPTFVHSITICQSTSESDTFSYSSSRSDRTAQQRQVSYTVVRAMPSASLRAGGYVTTD